jgi:DnaJ family protein C protein 8
MEVPTNEPVEFQNPKEKELDLFVRRILNFKNPFDVLDVPTDMIYDDMHKKYKKMSVKLHPDKCKHSRAAEAFAAINKALKELQSEETRNNYKAVMVRSEEEVIKEWEKMGKKRKATDDADFRWEMKKMTQKLLIEMEYKAKRAEEMRLANEKREKEKEIKKKEEEKEELVKEKQWDEKRDNRVDSKKIR